jgi:hypothetical protein
MAGESRAITRASPGRKIGRSLLKALTVFGLVATCLASSSAVPFAGAEGAAMPTTTTPPPGFELSGSNGYSVEVSGVAPKGALPAQVVVRVATLHASATYHFAGLVEEGSMQADLGPYGQISVVFHPVSGGMGTAELGCSRGLSSVAGYYEGTISFHAAGLTSVDASRAKGSVELALSLLCAEELEKELPMVPGPVLQVSGASMAPRLTVLQRHGGIATQIEARLSEDRGVEIDRSVSVGASKSSFTHQGLRTATVRLPAPFSGAATFDRDGARNKWRGNLRVDFPGRGSVALTGKDVRASLRRGHSG